MPWPPWMRAFGSGDPALIVGRGASLEILRQLVGTTGAGAVFWNRRCEPAVMTRDATIKSSLLKPGLKRGASTRPCSSSPIRAQIGRAFPGLHAVLEALPDPAGVGSILGAATGAAFGLAAVAGSQGIPVAAVHSVGCWVHEDMASGEAAPRRGSGEPLLRRR